MSTPRIVVTGIGASTPIGGTAPETWSALLQGVSGTHALEYDWVEKYQLPVKLAAEARRPPTPCSSAPSRIVSTRRRSSPSWRHGGVGGRRRPDVEPERFGVDFATGIGGLQTTLTAGTSSRRRGPAASCR